MASSLQQPIDEHAAWEAHIAAREAARPPKMRLQLTGSVFWGIVSAILVGNLFTAVIVWVIYDTVTH